MVAFAVLFALALAAYWDQTEYFARDDVFFKNAENGTYSLAVASYGNGRFMPGLIFHALAVMGWEIHTFWQLLAPVAYVTFAVFAYCFVSGLTDRFESTDKLLCAAIIVLFPFSINLIINKNNLINFICSYLAILAAIHFFKQKRSKIFPILCSAFIFLAAACYQTSIYYFLVFICAYCLFNGDTWWDVGRTLTRGALSLVLGLAAYMLFYKLTAAPLVSAFGSYADSQLLHHYAGSRTHINDLSAFIDATALYIFTVVRVLFAPEPILSGNLKLFALAVFALCFLRWSRTTNEQRVGSIANRRHYRITGVLVLVLLLLLGSPIHILIDEGRIAPRVLAHAGAVWAVLLLLAIRFTSGRLRDLTRICIAGYVLGLGISTANTVQGATQLFRHDLQLAARIVADLQTGKGFDKAKPVATIGLIDRDTPYEAVQTERFYDIHVSNFGSDWSKEAILEEASGLRFAHPSGVFREAGEEKCRMLRPFNGYYTTIVTDVGAIVCLADLLNRSEITDP